MGQKRVENEHDSKLNTKSIVSALKRLSFCGLAITAVNMALELDVKTKDIQMHLEEINHCASVLKIEM